MLVVAVGTCEGTTNDPKGVLRFSVGENEAGLSGMSEPVGVGKPCGLAVDGIGVDGLVAGGKAEDPRGAEGQQDGVAHLLRPFTALASSSEGPPDQVAAAA